MKTIFKYGLIVLLTFWIIIKGIIPAWDTIPSDFANYYVSSRIVIERGELENLYDNEWFQQQIKDHGMEVPGKFSPFPPLTAWVMLPLAYANPITAVRIWLVINVFLLGSCIWLIREITNWHWSLSSLTVVALSNGLINNFRFGQIYLLVTAGLFLVLWLAKRNNNRWAGFLLGLLASLKYLPIVLLPGFLFAKNYKLLISLGVSALGLLILQFIVFGSPVMQEFFYSVFLPHLNADLSGQGMYSYLFQSWDSLFRNLFVYSETFNPQPWINWPGGRVTGKLVIDGIVLISLLYSLKKVHAGKFSQDSKTSLFFALPFLAAFMILPASATYHFVLLVVPVTLLLSGDFFDEKEKTGIAFLFLAIGLVPYGFFFKIAAHAGLVFAYPRLWLISILYFGCIYQIVRKPAVLLQKG